MSKDEANRSNENPAEKHRFSATVAASKLPDAEGRRWLSVFSHGSLEAEVYAPRGNDPQQPHTRDEIYVVVEGRGDFVYGKDRASFAPGDFLFAPAGVEHRFENFSDDLIVWVFFYGPEGGEGQL
jgi:mannose-6-phosphate isomerase-like protein (cupin superfamily)